MLITSDGELSVILSEAYKLTVPKILYNLRKKWYISELYFMWK